jgi:hypothetical protein
VLLFAGAAVRAQSWQDSFRMNGAKAVLPRELRAMIKVKDGVVFSGEAAQDVTGVQLTLPILRCVTARNPGDRFPGSGQTFLERAIDDGLVTRETRFTLFLFVERRPGSPDGAVEISNLRLNGRQFGRDGVPAFLLNGRTTYIWNAPLRTGRAAELGRKESWNVIQVNEQSKFVRFGSPLFTCESHVDDLFRKSYDMRKAEQKDGLAPIPGMNLVQVSLSSKAAAGSARNLMSYRVHLYGMVEFGAMAPILFIHGTNASSSSWSEPSAIDDRTSTLKDDHGAVRTLDNTPLVKTEKGALGDFPSKYAGPWFYRIDLGPRERYRDDITERPGEDRYCHEPADPNGPDARGNASNKFSAEQLRQLIPLVLEMYGMNGPDTLNGKEWPDAKCHLVAHSKGGSDCRWLVTQILPLPAATRKDADIKPFKVLGFFSLGTPFRGTPTADIGYAFRQLQALGEQELRITSGQYLSSMVARNVSDAADAVSLLLRTRFSGNVPNGAALKEQSYQQKQINDGSTIDREDWQSFSQGGGRYFSV